MLEEIGFLAPGWQDLLEIIVVSAVFYRILVLLAGTRGPRGRFGSRCASVISSASFSCLSPSRSACTKCVKSDAGRPADARIAGLISMAGATRRLEQAMLEQAQYLTAADGSVTPDEQAFIDAMEALRYE